MKGRNKDRGGTAAKQLSLFCDLAGPETGAAASMWQGGAWVQCLA
jgi:hypothetical protein